MSSFNITTVLKLPELPSYIERVEQALGKTVETDNPFLSEPITRLLKTHGKRLRPSLVLAIVRGQDREVDQKTILASVALELVHLASLVHDDIIDAATDRRGVPTVNHTEGVNRAILVGDYLLARAQEQASMAGPRVAQTIAEAFTSMCDGQARELADAYNLNRTQASYLKAINGKTTALFAAACKIGGIRAKLPIEQVKALASYGENFGVAFQLIDDVLDFISTPELSGKPVGNDIKEGVYTLPLLLAIAGPHSEKVRRLLKDNTDASRLSLVDIVDRHGLINQTISEARRYNSLATDALRKLNDSLSPGIARLPEAYIDWALQNLVAPAYRSTVELEVLANVTE